MINFESLHLQIMPDNNKNYLIESNINGDHKTSTVPRFYVNMLMRLIRRFIADVNHCAWTTMGITACAISTDKYRVTITHDGIAEPPVEIDAQLLQNVIEIISDGLALVLVK